MKINVFSFDADVMYARKYLPTKRCRNVRTMTMLASHQFHVRKISSKEAPVAFKVTAFEADRTIRLFNGTLYGTIIQRGGYRFDDFLQPLLWEVRWQYQSLVDDQAPEGHMANYFVDRPYDMNKSVTLSDTFDKNCQKIQKHLDQKFLIIDGDLWVKTDEPRYEVVTMGLGHNHGGTAMFIEYNYNENISNDNYFRADQFKEAYDYAIKVAENRGDTDDVARFKEELKTRKLLNYIEVCIPEAVGLDPKKDAGKGNPLLNEMEDAISGSPDKQSAALGVFLTVLTHLK